MTCAGIVIATRVVSIVNDDDDGVVVAKAASKGCRGVPTSIIMDSD